jgi:hypothetical protein
MVVPPIFEAPHAFGSGKCDHATRSMMISSPLEHRVMPDGTHF